MRNAGGGQSAWGIGTMARDSRHVTLGVISFGFAIGVTWGVAVLFLAVMAGMFGWGVALVVILQNLYLGYGPNFVGAITGAVWGFANGFVFGVLVAWSYNRALLSRQRHVLPHAEETNPEQE
jgi:hypothetical protein